MDIESEIEKLEDAKEFQQKKIDRRSTALRLAENKDFIEIITEGYLRDEAARLASILGDERMTDDDQKVINDLRGIGSLIRYLKTIEINGQIAQKEYDSADRYIDDLRQNGEE